MKQLHELKKIKPREEMTYDELVVELKKYTDASEALTVLEELFHRVLGKPDDENK